MSNDTLKNYDTQKYKALVNKSFTLETGWQTIYTGRILFKSSQLYINNKGPSWIMVKIMDKDGFTLVPPSEGIKPNHMGGPYSAPSNRKFHIMVKAGQAGTYPLQVLQLK